MDLAYKILSFLSVDRLVDTLQKVLSHHNLEQLLQCHTSQIFGHGKNLDSSYGFVTLSKLHKMLRWLRLSMSPCSGKSFPRRGTLS
jgi:hypothetical protein